MDGAKATLRTDAELERPPGDTRRAVGVPHAKSWGRNIHASNPAHYTFCQWDQCLIPYLLALREMVEASTSRMLAALPHELAIAKVF